MRYLLFFLILIMTGCWGEQNADQQVEIDTVKLFNPNGHPDNAGASDMNMFKSAVSVFQQHYAIILNDKETDLETLSEVDSFIISNKDGIKKDLFYVLMDSSTDFKRTVSVSKTLTRNEISKYKVISIQEYFTPPDRASTDELQNII